MITLKSILTFLKLNKYILWVLIVVGIFSSGLYFGIKAYKSEMQRQENNYLAALQEIRGDMKEGQRVYELKISELNRQFPEIKNQLKEMNIKLKNVVSLENINTQTKTEINTHIRDTIVYDTIPARIATYKDQWTDFKMLEIGDKLQASITTKDSIVCVLNKVKRSFGQWIRKDPKMVRNTIKSYNPNSTILYNRLIKIEK